MDMTVTQYIEELNVYKANLKAIEDKADQARKLKKYRISGKLMKEYWSEHGRMCAFIEEHPVQDASIAKKRWKGL
jgi:hypothetical protein